MIVCAYEYSDGICGVTEAAHSENLNALARHGHTFTGAEIRRSVDAEVGADGVARFTRPLKAGQVYVVPMEVLDAVIAHPDRVDSCIHTQHDFEDPTNAKD